MPETPTAGSPTAIDLAYRRAQLGDHEGFADWVRQVEHPLRSSLRRFARQVDVETIVQEALMRMWIVARRRKLEGRDASLRYALTLARNLAVREAKRLGLFQPLPERDSHDTPAQPDPLPDPALRRAIVECVDKLRPKLKKVLGARLARSPTNSDRAIAADLGMRVNTFLQNVVRARKAVLACLESRGIRLQEILR